MVKIIGKKSVGRKKVFDISMPVNHNFVANGIVVHNCDFANRDVIVEYLSEKYGDNFAYIPTDMLMRFKSSLLDVERSVHGKVPDSIAQMCKSIKGAQQGQSDKEWLFGYTDKTTGEHIKGFIDLDDPIAEQLREYRDAHPDRWNVIMKCIGTIKTRGIHAGGIVVTPGPVWDYFPVIKTDKGYASAYEMKNLEAVGGIKYDFLGVSTLNAMSSALEGIRKDRGEDIKWDEFIDDEDVFVNIVHKMDLGGLFQIDTKSMKPFVAKTKPRNIRDLAVLIALVRPGTLDAKAPNPNFKGSAADYYVACKTNTEKPYYIHPELEPILRDTEGILLAQEQALEIFRKLAGYSYAEAEEVRRAIGKKVKSVMDHHLGVLSEKCISRGWTEQQAKDLCETIVASARYSFNFGHSCISLKQKVITEFGTKSILELMENTEKVGFINTDGELEFEYPKKIFHNGKKEILQITFENDSVIEITSDHKVWCNGGWIEISEAIESGQEFEIYDKESGFVPVRG
jgi:DNA polymerase-3 subunit alpha